MAGPPAKCLNPNCGHVFELANFIGGSGTVTNLVMSGNSTRCPRCDFKAVMGDGVYEYSGGQMRLKHGPPLTESMLEKLARIAQAAKTKTIETEELLAEVADVSPELARNLRDRGLGYFTIILLLLWLIKSVSLNVTVDLNELIDQAQGAASETDDANVFEIPLPPSMTEPSEIPDTSIAAQQVQPMSRQVRRHLDRQLRKKNGKGERPA